MSTDQMRRAATKLRTAAAAATEGFTGYQGQALEPSAWPDEMDGMIGGPIGEYLGMVGPVVAGALADWLDVEAALIDGLGPVIDVWNMAIAKDGGPVGHFRLLVDEDGKPTFHLDSTSHASKLAALVLGEPVA